jgi:hypothetical protein
MASSPLTVHNRVKMRSLPWSMWQIMNWCPVSSLSSDPLGCVSATGDYVAPSTNCGDRFGFGQSATGLPSPIGYDFYFSCYWSLN